MRASSTPRGSIAGGGTRTVCPVVDLRLPCGIRRGEGRGVSAPRRDAGRPSIHSGDRSLAGRVGRGERNCGDDGWILGTRVARTVSLV